jgi:DMSO/TMAO reductase YedYZ heme-binding membrane subunit
MSTIVRISVIAATLGALGALWVVTSPLTAIAAGSSIFAFLFVLAVKSAAEEIRRFEREQRPDLYA